MHKLFGYKVVNRFWFSCHTVEEIWTKEKIKEITNLWCHRLDTALSFPCHWRNHHRGTEWLEQRKKNTHKTNSSRSLCTMLNISKNSSAVSIPTIFNISNSPAWIHVYSWQWGYRVQCAPRGACHFSPQDNDLKRKFM